MMNLMIFILLTMFSGPVAAGKPSAESKVIPLEEIGRRIYQDGIVSSGEALQGEGAAKITFSGKLAACVRCHRKSGLGTSEGNNIISPIAGGYVFKVEESDEHDEVATPTVFRQRALLRQGRSHAAYTFATFARALRDGVDSGGHTMDSLMPRYVLNDEDVSALEAYLKTLSTHPDPGVDKTTIHFATVVMPGVEPERTKAMLDVLNAYFADKNAGTRSEGQRRAVGTEAMYNAYRQWKLHVWTLTGSPDGWLAQLEQHYRQQPVFALLSGIGDTSWQVPHEFCEQQKIPCLFPNSELPVTGSGYYSFYFSRGMALETEVLVRHLSGISGQGGMVMQVFREDDSLGVEVAQIFRRSLKNAGLDFHIDDWSYSGSPDVKSWQRILAEKHPQYLVMWLNADDLVRLGSWDVKGYSPQQIYLSASMLGGRLEGDTGWLNYYMGKQSDRSLESVRLIYPFELPDKKALHLNRTSVWLHAKNIPTADERVQENTYFAAMVAGDSISHLFRHFSRDYFIERIEHMAGRLLVTSVYPRSSLGPEQRYISKGAYLVKYSRGKGRVVEPVSGWIVP